MKKTILTYGIISGVIVAVVMFGSMAIWGSSEKETGSIWLGYAIMIISLSLIFFGVKSFRDEELGGVIKFWTALKAGLGISLVAGVIYVIGWEIYLALTPGDFIEQYAQSYLLQLKEGGATAAELDEAEEMMETYRQLYDNVITRMGITLTEILPVGIVISLISAGLLSKSDFLRAEPENNAEESA